MARRRETAASGVAVRNAIYWEVLPGEKFQITSPLGHPVLAAFPSGSWNTKLGDGQATVDVRSGVAVAVGNDVAVRMLYDPSRRVDRGIAPFWRVKGGQIFVVLPNQDAGLRIEDRFEPYEFLMKHANGAIRVFGGSTITSPADRLRVAIIPLAPGYLGQDVADCDSCQGIGWLVVDTGRGHGLTVERCNSCQAFSDDASAANVARSCGLLVSPGHPHTLAGTQPRRKTFHIELTISLEHGEDVSENGLAEMIGATISNQCTVLQLEANLVPSEPGPVMTPVARDVERTRVIDLQDDQ